MFEKKNEKLLPRSKFLIRMLKFTVLLLVIIIVSLFIGILGYTQIEHLSFFDAFLNSAMLMGGMGPANTIYTDAGKTFAGIYALYCGFILLISIGIFMTPIFHRLLHHFHLENK